MKIHIIFPPHTLEERFDKNIAKAAGVLPPLGILYISAVLKAKGHDVSVSDGSIEDFNTILNKLQKEKPEIVGISALTFLWNRAKKMAKEIKKLLPEAFIVIGGPHPTFYGRRCLEESADIDAVIVGEGEETMLKLAENFSNHAFKKINGLIHRSNGKIIQNPLRPLITNLDKIPFPARELIDITDYVPSANEYKVLPTTNIMGSRGCPFQCIYCSKISGRVARFRSPENIIAEMEELVNKYKVKGIAFHDDIFTANRKLVLDFISLLKQSGLDILWSVNARVNTVNKELLKKMSDAGCWKIFYGAESMLQKNLDVLKKGTTVQQIFDAIKWSKDAGIEVEASFIFGIPGETYEDALKTIDLIKKLNPDYAKFFVLTPLPGTELYDNVDRYGKLLSNNFDDMTTHKVIFTPNTMTKEELESLVPIAYKKFYLRFGYILNRLLKTRGINDIRCGYAAFKALVSM